MVALFSLRASEAVIATGVVVVTAFVVIVKLAVVAPAATVTVVGTVAAAVFALASFTTHPPAGAAEWRVMVAVDVLVPTTEVGFSVSVTTESSSTLKVAALLLKASEAVIFTL